MNAPLHYVTVNEEYTDFATTPEAAETYALTHREMSPDADVETGQFLDDNQNIDVWFRFENPEDKETEAEANTFLDVDGTYRIEWYLNSVGLVTKVRFHDYASVRDWYESNGFQDFTDYTGRV